MDYTIVKDLCNAMLAVIATELGADYKPFDYIYDVTKNSLRGDYQRYGVRPLSLSSDTGVTRALTVNQDFQIMICTNFVNKPTDDSKQRAAIFTLYEKMNKVFNKLFLSKVNMPDKVMTVRSLSLPEPEIFDEEHTALLRGNITVTYRQLIN